MSHGSHARARERRKDRRDLLAVATATTCLAALGGCCIAVYVVTDHNLSATAVTLFAGLLGALATGAITARDPNSLMFDVRKDENGG